MPVFIAALLGGLVQAAGTLVGRVLLSLGIGFATFQGIDTTMAWGKSMFLSNLAGLPAVGVQLAGYMKVGVCVSMLMSALVVRLTIQGLSGGTLKKMVQK